MLGPGQRAHPSETTSVRRTFKRFHRGGSGAPLLCLHGFLDTWRSWELVLPALELDAVGWPRAHLVGNSLGGRVALQLAARRRAETGTDDRLRLHLAVIGASVAPTG